MADNPDVIEEKQHETTSSLLDKVTEEEPHHHGDEEEENLKKHADPPKFDEPKRKEYDVVSERSKKAYRLFGRERPVHKVFGGGKPADIFLWRNKKVSASVLGGATLVWVLFELLEYHLLTLVCHILIVGLVLVFLWSNASVFINKSPPRIPEVRIPQDPFLQIASALRIEINQGLAFLRKIASGRDLKKFLAVTAGLWVLSVVGSWFNFLTLFYIAFVLLHTVPVLYEMYEDQVDAFADRAMVEFKKQYAVFDEKVLSKIPRGPLKDKRA